MKPQQPATLAFAICLTTEQTPDCVRRKKQLPAASNPHVRDMPDKRADTRLRQKIKIYCQNVRTAAR